MKTVILCGGKGLRYGSFKPKGLALIGNKPIVHRVIDIYYNQGYNDFLLILGYKGKDIEKYFSSLKKYKLEYVYIKENMNKGGALVLARNFVGSDENFFCTYCDCLADINLNYLLAHHEHDNVATITVIRPVSEFGIVLFGIHGNKIVEFKEKPQMDSWTNGGFFVFNRNIFDHIYSDEDNLETDIFNRLVSSKQMGGYRHNGFWSTVNSMKDELRLNDIYKNEMGHTHLVE